MRQGSISTDWGIATRSTTRQKTIVRVKRLSEEARVAQAVYLREALDDLLKKYAAALRKVGK
jgi:hypothetical protein